MTFCNESIFMLLEYFINKKFVDNVNKIEIIPSYLLIFIDATSIA